MAVYIESGTDKGLVKVTDTNAPVGQQEKSWPKSNMVLTPNGGDSLTLKSGDQSKTIHAAEVALPAGDWTGNASGLIEVLSKSPYFFSAVSGGGGNIADGTAVGQVAVWDGSEWQPSETLIDESASDYVLVLPPAGKALAATGTNSDGADWTLNMGAGGNVQIYINDTASGGNQTGILMEGVTGGNPSVKLQAIDAGGNINSELALLTNAPATLNGGNIPYSLRTATAIDALTEPGAGFGLIQFAGAKAGRLQINSATAGMGVRPFVSVTSADGATTLLAATKPVSDNDVFDLNLAEAGIGAVAVVITTPASGYTQYDVTVMLEILT